jgi:hypothetical protein
MRPMVHQPARSFGVAHTSFDPAFLPDSTLMNGHCINAKLATGTARKLYRFHYNLTDGFPSN